MHRLKNIEKKFQQMQKGHNIFIDRVISTFTQL